MFLRSSHAIALFPGGFGTMDEGFEVLTLVQTGKSVPIPIVFIESPGGDYWSSWQDYVKKQLLARGLNELRIDAVGDGGHQHIRLAHGLCQRHVAHRPVAVIQARVEQLPHARLDRIRQLAGDDHERLLGRHVTLR